MSRAKLKIHALMAKDRETFRHLSERTLNLVWLAAGHFDYLYTDPTYLTVGLTPFEYRLIARRIETGCFPGLHRETLREYLQDLRGRIPPPGRHRVPPVAAGARQRDDVSVNEDKPREKMLADLELVEIFFGCDLASIDNAVFDIFFTEGDTPLFLRRCPTTDMLPRHIVSNPHNPRFDTDGLLPHVVRDVRCSPDRTRWIIENLTDQWSNLTDQWSWNEDVIYSFASLSDAMMFRLYFSEPA